MFYVSFQTILKAVCAGKSFCHRKLEVSIAWYCLFLITRVLSLKGIPHQVIMCVVGVDFGCGFFSVSFFFFFSYYYFLIIIIIIIIFFFFFLGGGGGRVLVCLFVVSSFSSSSSFSLLVYMTSILRQLLQIPVIDIWILYLLVCFNDFGTRYNFICMCVNITICVYTLDSDSDGGGGCSNSWGHSLDGVKPRSYISGF